MKCADCKFAEWKRTESGRLSPKGFGKCTWSKTVRIAPGAGDTFRHDVTKITLTGGNIWRKDYPVVSCPVFEPAK